jgi:flagellar hook assembly protein FlgD
MTGVTTIAFRVTRRDTPAELLIFDVTGRLVRDLEVGRLEPGMHEVRWDGRTSAGRLAPAGLYFYRMTHGDFQATRKLVRLR